MGKVIDLVAERVGVTVGEISLYQGENSEEPKSRDTTVSGLGLSIVSVLYGRGRAGPVLLDITPTDNMETVINKFSAQAGIERSKLKFFFDGETLEGNDTAEDLELEGSECSYIHVIE